MDKGGEKEVVIKVRCVGKIQLGLGEVKRGGIQVRKGEIHGGIEGTEQGI